MHQWRPLVAHDGDLNDGDPDDGDLDGVGARVALGPWSRPALRGLILLLAIIAAVVGYLVWQAQPRSVVVPSGITPEVMATGAPITGAPAEDPASADAPAAAASTEPPEVYASGAAAEIVVHVTGLVRSPGLVRLPAGSRVADAIEQAGGVTRRRAEGSVNLARVLADGEQIVVADAPPPGAGGSVAGGAAVGGSAVGGSAATAGAGVILDLNAATLEQLDGLPGVGPVLAGRILQWRTTHGRFRSVDELGEVSGIGDAILGQLRPLVRV